MLGFGLWGRPTFSRSSAPGTSCPAQSLKRHPTPDIWSSWRMEAKNKLQSQYHAAFIYFPTIGHSNTIDTWISWISWIFIWGQTTSSSVQCWRSSELCLAGEELRLLIGWSLDFQLNSSELFRTLQNSSELFDWPLLNSSEEFWILQNKSINPSWQDLVWSSCALSVCLKSMVCPVPRERRPGGDLSCKKGTLWATTGGLRALTGAIWCNCESWPSTETTELFLRGVGRVTGYRWYSRVIGGRPSSSSLSRNRMSWSVAQRAAPTVGSW